MCWAPLGGIVAKPNQPQSVGYPISIVEVEKSDSRAPSCGNTFNQSAVEAKVAIPPLLTWIEEKDDFVRGGVNRGEV